MKKNILAFMAVLLLASCSAGKEPAQTTSSASTTASAVTEATAEETTGAQITEKSEVESETEASETTAKKDDSVPTDEKKGLPIDFCVVEGLEFGMTTDEVKAVMGEPDSTSEYEGLLVYKYGKSEIRFGDVSGSVNEVVADHKSDLKKETTEDSGERLMTMINIYDDSLDSHLYGGITFGSDAGKIKEKYYHEEIKDLPADLQKATDEGQFEMFYGLDDFVLGIPDADDDSLHSVGFYTGKQADMPAMIFYQTYEGNEMNFVIYEIDDDNKVSYINSMRSVYR